MNSSPGTTIEAFNKQCFCTSLDESLLRTALESELGEPGLADLVRERCPYLFSASPVFVSRAHMERMAAVVQAIEAMAALPAWQEEVLAWAPPVARHVPGNKGVFFGHDFHVAAEGFGLIEINTNAGGAMLNAVLAHAQFACCDMIATLPRLPALGHALEGGIVAMFRREWALAGRQAPLRTIAIVDAAPKEQYLYPEFLLFRRLFEREGLDAVMPTPRSYGGVTAGSGTATSPSTSSTTASPTSPCRTARVRNCAKRTCRMPWC